MTKHNTIIHSSRGSTFIIVAPRKRKRERN